MINKGNPRGHMTPKLMVLNVKMDDHIIMHVGRAANKPR